MPRDTLQLWLVQVVQRAYPEVHLIIIALGTQAELTRQVGEYDALVLEIEESEVLDAYVEAVRDMPSVIQAEVTDGSVTLLAPEAEEILVPAITQANALGVKIRAANIEEPNLEAVFLHLTGRALRD